MIHAESSLLADVAFIAYHFGWSSDEILDLEHPRRRLFIDEIAKLNARANGTR